MTLTRTLAALAALTLPLSLTACGTKSEDQGSSSTSASSSAAEASAGASTGTASQGGAATKVVAPKNLDAKSQGVIANPDGPASNTLSVYADPQCPFCAKAEEVTGPAIEEAVKNKTARVLVHPMIFLDDAIQNDSSATLANALVCASEAGKTLEFQKAMFAAQPEKEGDGYAADATKTVADQAGLTGAERTTYDACVSSKKYVPWVKQAQAQYTKDGVKGTPTYLLNGEKLDLSQMTEDDLKTKLAGTK